MRGFALNLTKDAAKIRLGNTLFFLRWTTPKGRPPKEKTLCPFPDLYVIHSA